MKRSAILLISLILLCAQPSSAQDWKSIVPLKSKCKDIRKIFNEPACSFPVFDIKRSDYELNISFATKDVNPTLSTDTVVHVLVGFNPLIRLEDFESRLADYEILPDGDIDNGRIYRHKTKGFEFYAQEVSATQWWVTGARLFPAKRKTR